MTRGLLHIASILRLSLRQSAGWIVFSLLLSACVEITHVEYSQFDTFKTKGIPLGWVADFSPHPADSAELDRSLYDVVLTIRFNSRSRSRNIVLDIEEYSLSHPAPDSTRLDLTLFSDNGKPLGNGNLGLFEITDTLRHGVPIHEGYSVSISTPLSPEETVGINAIGISLSKTGSITPLRIKNPLN
ncbi:MAG: hypothetical protein K2G90_02040 [Muribaculaceae bacterium]|nr:hypothetical protein [Muribaculaceae bacterium]